MCYCYLLFLLFCGIKAGQSLRLCCQCINRPGLTLKVALLWAGGWTGWPPGVPSNLLEAFFSLYRNWPTNVITPLSFHPRLSAENHLSCCWPRFCSVSAGWSPGDTGWWQSEPQWPLWSPSVLLMAPALTSQGRVPFLGKVLSNMAL